MPHKRSKNNNTFMSYSRYKMDFGMKVPKATRHYNRKKASQKYQIQNSVNVYNYSQNRSSAFAEESINFDMVSENTNFNISEEHIEQQQELELERQFLEIIEESRDSIIDKPDKIEIACGLLSIFFSGKMTQHALTLVMKLVNILMKDDKLPKSFDELVKIILKNNNDNTRYAKKWYCFICKIFVTLNKEDKEQRFQRKCNKCKERYNIIYR